jgi:ATP-dependent Lon protease
MAAVVDQYTRESGVRGLDKQLAALARKAAKARALDEAFPEQPSTEEVKALLGTARFDRDRAIGNDVAGVATGLAWTPVGGDILFLESTVSPGSGKLSLTGNLGNVMKESATIALTYLKSNAEALGLNPVWFTKNDVHVHVPEGATPKDGPSAGIAMLTALMSLFTQRKVRSKLALSGEITLRGTVLPVGGIREKLLAAKRSGIKTVLLCADNEKDVNDIPAAYLKGMEVRYVRTMAEVLEFAVLAEKVKAPKGLSEA